MKVALFVGHHNGDTLAVRAGWALTRLAQKGPYEHVTHCEAILSGGCNDAVIASSSLREGGVRIKHGVKLDPANWWIVDVPLWAADDACQWFIAHSGEPYDWRGAMASVLPGSDGSGYFCNESVGASVGLKTPDRFTPSTFAAVCFTLGRDVTSDFFGE